jgi:hypothetical protein
MEKFTKLKTFTLLSMVRALDCEACLLQEECDRRYGVYPGGDGEGASPVDCLNLWIESND